MKVFGIGLNKTGTTTLGVCLKTLEFEHTSHHLEMTRHWYKGELAPVFEWVDRFESFEDWPWPLMYKELDDRYPDSKFILTTRKSARAWFRSLRKHADRIGPTEFRELVYGHAMPHDHKREHVAMYRRHNDAVRRHFKGRPEDFLEVCWERGSGWTDLCAFLNRPLPNAPFPHAHKSPDRFVEFCRKAYRRSIRVLGRPANA